MPVTIPSLRSHNPAIPGAVESIIQRALSFDPEARFADATEMATALDLVLRDLAEHPLDSYPSVSLPPLPGAGGPRLTEQDHTEFMEDERTLLAPDLPAEPAKAPPPPSRAAPPAAARPAKPGAKSAKPAVERPRRRVAPFVWIFGLLALAAAVAWVVLQGGVGGRFAAAPEPQPDTMAIVPVDSVLPDSGPTQPGLDAFIHNQEGNRLYIAGQFQPAYQQFSQAVGLQPDSASYRRNLALALLKLGRPAEAEQQLRQALQLDPGLVVVYANLAQAQLARADTTAAIASLERFDELGPAGRPKQLAQQQLRELRAARAGLLGVPISPADTARRDTARAPAN
jgi:tetratricopeptide (TPR) repeat protein